MHIVKSRRSRGDGNFDGKVPAWDDELYGKYEKLKVSTRHGAAMLASNARRRHSGVSTSTGFTGNSGNIAFSDVSSVVSRQESSAIPLYQQPRTGGSGEFSSAYFLIVSDFFPTPLCSWK